MERVGCNRGASVERENRADRGLSSACMAKCLKDVSGDRVDNGYSSLISPFCLTIENSLGFVAFSLRSAVGKAKPFRPSMVQSLSPEAVLVLTIILNRLSGSLRRSRLLGTVQLT